MNDNQQGKATDLGDITKDPVQERLLADSLEQLARQSPSTALREMANEVLDGRIGLREAGAVQAYAEEIADQAQPFKEYWASLSDDERERLAAEGFEVESSKVGKARCEETPPARPSTDRTNRHSGKGWSLY